MVLPLDDGHGHRIEVAGNPIKFTGEPAVTNTYPPALGEHSTRVLADVLQWDAQRIEALFAAGVLKTVDATAPAPAV
jgi:crotonobetainyl-CoA:carnitine CoA-transferase CaiB-like acyl-CoA transferase